MRAGVSTPEMSVGTDLVEASGIEMLLAAKGYTVSPLELECISNQSCNHANLERIHEDQP